MTLHRVATVAACCGLVVAGHLLASCYDLADHTPFPCPEDGICPDPFVCVPQGCVLSGDLGNYVPFPCGSDGSCVEGYTCVDDLGCVPPFECDPVAQSCSDSDRTKCSEVLLADGTSMPVCLEPTGGG